MAVNTLVTGLIAFRILKVFLEVKPTSVERSLGSLGSTGDTKLRNVIFIIIESGMALFAIQLVRIVLSYISLPPKAIDFVISINQMLNVVIKSVLFYLFLFTYNI